MNNLHTYSQKELNQLTRSRANENKIGQEIKTISDANHWQRELEVMSCQFVLLGIPEDIGVRANYGRGGAHTAWKPALEGFLNQQSNEFLSGKNSCVLGHIEVEDLMEQANHLSTKKEEDITEFRKLVSEIDMRVSAVIKAISACGKIPIIVGGGHNNAYPIIKGFSEGLASKINVINCDPHTDFRPLEGRHSGNGFSYAYKENYISKYSVFCMHEQYNTSQVLGDFTKDNGQLYFSTYEDVFVRESKTFATTLNQNIGFVKNNLCGVEIDLDAITNVPSSANTRH